MSDHADLSDGLIDSTVQAGVARARQGQRLTPHGRCHFCDDDIDAGLVFCNTDCRDDFETLNAAMLRNGR